jgi:hypothetical protein
MENNSIHIGTGRWYPPHITPKGTHVPGKFSVNKDSADVISMFLNAKEQVLIETDEIKGTICIRKLPKSKR